MNVAIKIIDKASLNALELAHIHQETRVMKLIKHPNVVQLHQVYASFSKIYIVFFSIKQDKMVDWLGGGEATYRHDNLIYITGVHYFLKCKLVILCL